MNLTLSQHRADAIRAAIFDAAGKPGQGAIPKGKVIQALGKGAKPFEPEFAETIAKGLHVDPFSPRVTFDGKGNAVSDEAKAW